MARRVAAWQAGWVHTMLVSRPSTSTRSRPQVTGPRRVRLKALGADAHKDLAVRGAGHRPWTGWPPSWSTPPFDFALKHVDGRRAQELRHKQVLGVVVDLLGGALLHQQAVAHHHNPVGDAHGLLLVVGDKQGGDAGALSGFSQISSRVCSRSRASRLERGSSSKSTRGIFTRARAMATRCCWPPESSWGLRSRSSSICTSLAVSRARLAHLLAGGPVLAL